eukprot:387167_1
MPRRACRAGARRAARASLRGPHRTQLGNRRFGGAAPHRAKGIRQAAGSHRPDCISHSFHEVDALLLGRRAEEPAERALVEPDAGERGALSGCVPVPAGSHGSQPPVCRAQEDVLHRAAVRPEWNGAEERMSRR